MTCRVVDAIIVHVIRMYYWKCMPIPSLRIFFTCIIIAQNISIIKKYSFIICGYMILIYTHLKEFR